MRSTGLKLLVAITVLFVAALFVSCGTDEPADDSPAVGSGDGPGIEIQQLDPATVALEQILLRARDAMGAVTSFKTRGATEIQRSIGSDFARFQQVDEFREWQSPDRLYIRSEIAGSGFRDAVLNESVNLSDQVYIRNFDNIWIQVESSLSSGWQERAFSAHVIILDAPDMKLVSRNEETDDGTKTYRLEYTESPFLALHEEAQAESEAPGLIDQPEFIEPVFTSFTTLLIDQQTFRILVQINDSITEPIQGDQNSVAVDSSTVVSSFGANERRSSVQTTYYYDYNIPNVIEPPTEYMTASEFNSSLAQIERDQPPVLPEGMFTGNCSEPGVSWPDCAVESAAEFESMLSLFPDDHKIVVGDDVVITFAFEGPPDIDWLADLFIWHAPSGSFMIMCVSNSPEPEINGWKFTGSSHQRGFPEAEPRISQVWADDEVADLIRSRNYEVTGSCE